MLQSLPKGYRVSVKIPSFAREKCLMCRRTRRWGNRTPTPVPPFGDAPDSISDGCNLFMRIETGLCSYIYSQYQS